MLMASIEVDFGRIVGIFIEVLWFELCITAFTCLLSIGAQDTGLFASHLD
jgi:hypothetical protein